MAAYINRQTNRELSHAHYCMVAGELSLPQNRPDQANLKQPIVLINKNLISPTMLVIESLVFILQTLVPVWKKAYRTVSTVVLSYATLASLWFKKWGYLFPSPFSLPFPLSLSFLLPSTPLPVPFPLPNPATGIRERCELPQWGLGQSPRRNWI